MKNPLSIGSFMGMDIIQHEPKRRPKMQLSADCPVTDEFRAEMNKWMAEFFGYHDDAIFKPGTAFVFGNTIVMRREDVARITDLI